MGKARKPYEFLFRVEQRNPVNGGPLRQPEVAVVKARSAWDAMRQAAALYGYEGLAEVFRPGVLRVRSRSSGNCWFCSAQRVAIRSHVPAGRRQLEVSYAD